MFIKRGNLDTDTHAGRIPCENEGRDWGDTSTSQGTPKIASKPPEFGIQGGNRIFFSSQPLEGTHIADILMLDF